jgi:hypothetical protein
MNRYFALKVVRSGVANLDYARDVGLVVFGH